jgi:hypothetical protein
MGFNGNIPNNVELSHLNGNIPYKFPGIKFLGWDLMEIYGNIYMG